MDSAAPGQSRESGKVQIRDSEQGPKLPRSEAAVFLSEAQRLRG